MGIGHYLKAWANVDSRYDTYRGKVTCRPNCNSKVGGPPFFTVTMAIFMLIMHYEYSGWNQVYSEYYQWSDKLATVLEGYTPAEINDFNALQTIPERNTWFQQRSEDVKIPLTEIAEAELEPLAFYPWKRAQIWRYFTYSWIHLSTAHLWVNVIMLLLAGIPLELVHDGLIVALVYIGGTVTGAIYNYWISKTVLLGASAGVYALMFTHISNFIVNGDIFSLKFFAMHLALNVPMIGLMIANIVMIKQGTSSSFASHFAGIFTGLTLGIRLLRNSLEQRWEKIIRYTGLGIFTIFAIMGFLVQFKTFHHPIHITAGYVMPEINGAAWDSWHAKGASHGTDDQRCIKYSLVGSGDVENLSVKVTYSDGDDEFDMRSDDNMICSDKFNDAGGYTISSVELKRSSAVANGFDVARLEVEDHAGWELYVMSESDGSVTKSKFPIFEIKSTGLACDADMYCFDSASETLTAWEDLTGSRSLCVKSEGQDMDGTTTESHVFTATYRFVSGASTFSQVDKTFTSTDQSGDQSTCLNVAFSDVPLNAEIVNMVAKQTGGDENYDVTKFEAQNGYGQWKQYKLGNNEAFSIAGTSCGSGVNSDACCAGADGCVLSPEFVNPACNGDDCGCYEGWCWKLISDWTSGSWCYSYPNMDEDGIFIHLLDNQHKELFDRNRDYTCSDDAQCSEIFDCS